MIEHVRGLAVAWTVHSCDPPLTLDSKDVISEPVGGVGNVTNISVVDTGVVCTPESAIGM